MSTLTPIRTIPVARPLIGAEEEKAVIEVLRSGWLAQGARVAEFEKRFAEYVGAAQAVAVSSCTTALHLALVAAGVQPGDEVLCPSLSFIATANSIRYAGATPVFVDIDPATYNFDPACIEQAITPHTRAILVVHQIGLPAAMSEIAEIATRHGLIVIEDAACAVGSEVWWNGRWERIGKPHGNVACFSFHPRKLITTGEGGILTTNNVEFDRKFRLWRQHSMSVPDTVRHRANRVILECYPEVGFNSMS